MACEDVDTVTAALVAAASGPKSVSSDGLSVDQHRLRDLVLARNVVAADCAARTVSRGIRFTQLVPPGTVQ